MFPNVEVLEYRINLEWRKTAIFGFNKIHPVKVIITNAWKQMLPMRRRNKWVVLLYQKCRLLISMSY